MEILYRLKDREIKNARPREKDYRMSGIRGAVPNKF
jgi:hypothetical protein